MQERGSPCPNLVLYYHPICLYQEIATHFLFWKCSRSYCSAQQDVSGTAHACRCNKPTHRDPFMNTGLGVPKTVSKKHALSVSFITPVCLISSSLQTTSTSVSEPLLLTADPGGLKQNLKKLSQVDTEQGTLSQHLSDEASLCSGLVKEWKVTANW